jgi:hypothetical protein
MFRRTAPLIALALAAVLALTGCGPVNAGSGAIAAFARHMTGVPGVIETDGSGSNSLPFMGSASVSVTITDDASVEDVTRIVDRAAAFMRDYPYSITWGGTAHVGGFWFDFRYDDDVNAATIGLYDLVRAQEGVKGGEIGSGHRASRIGLTQDADVVAVLTQLLTLDFGGPVTAIGGTTMITSTADGRLPEAEIAAMEAIATEYTILGARVEPNFVSLQLYSDGDVGGATALAAALPGTAAIVFEITGGIVTREGEGSFALVDPIIAQAVALPGVKAIRAEPMELSFTVATLDDVTALEAIIASGVDLAGVTVNYRSWEGSPLGFVLYGPAERRATHLPVIAALHAGGYVQRVEVLADRLEVLAGPYDEDRMAQLAADLKAVLPAGSQVRLTNTVGGVNFTFIAGPTISVEDDKSYGDVDAESFVEAWNGI